MVRVYFKIQNRIKCISVCCFNLSIYLIVLTPFTLIAQETLKQDSVDSIAAEQALLMSWKLINVPKYLESVAVKGLQSSAAKLTAKLLQDGVKLNSYVKKQQNTKITSNMSRATSKIIIGQSADLLKSIRNKYQVASNTRLIISPLWMRTKTGYVFALQVLSMSTLQIYNSVHIYISTEVVQKSVKNKSIEQLVLGATEKIITKLAQQINSGTDKKKGSVLKLRVNLVNYNKQVVVVLLEEYLMKKYKVLASLNMNTIRLSKRALKEEESNARANRLLQVWHSKPDASVLEGDYAIKFTEAVFGQNIGAINQSLKFELKDDQYSIMQVAQLEQFLLLLSDSLKVDDLPQIAKINRAWVYVDRGRAWGLKINDRLVIESGSGGNIEGHVVRFFGANLNIKSPRGFTIGEGAIIYIRKNQAQTKIGQAFTYDKKQYPN